MCSPELKFASLCCSEPQISSNSKLALAKIMASQLARHPERSEAPAERSRKPALSVVEGDPVYVCSTYGLDRHFHHKSAFQQIVAHNKRARPKPCPLSHQQVQSLRTHSMNPARAISAFTAIRCSTLSGCNVFSIASASNRSPLTPSNFPIKAETAAGNVFRVIRAACAFRSVLALSSSATRDCKLAESWVSLPAPASSELNCSSTAATIRSTFAFRASC